MISETFGDSGDTGVATFDGSWNCFACAPSEAVYVGDEIRDAQAAAALGIDFLGVGWGYTRPDALQPHTRHEVCANSQSLLTAIAAR